MGKKILFILVLIAFGLSFACSTNPEKKKKVEEEKKTTELPDPDTKFAGSLACSICHMNEYNRWKGSLHASFIRRTDKNPGVITDSDFDKIDDFKEGIILGDTTNFPRNDIGFTSYYFGLVSPRLVYDTTGYKIKIENNSYPINYTIGGNGFWKQLFLTKINNLNFMLPVQYNEISNTWVFYDSASWYTGKTPHAPASSASWEKNCSGCHSSGLVYAGKNEDGDYITLYKELNIGCEACHGSGIEHINSNNKNGTIINPEKLNLSKTNDICARCHSRGRSYPNGIFPFAYNDSTGAYFNPGEDLKNFFVFNDADSFLDYSRSQKLNHAQANEFNGSSHSIAGLKCFSCHDPHNGDYSHSLRMDTKNNSICLNENCHSSLLDSKKKLSGITTDGDISGHTKHKVDKNLPSQPVTGNGSECISCHMVLTGTSATASDLSNHSFNILYPVETNILLNNRTNSCMNRNCHSNYDNSVNKWSYLNETDNNNATQLITNLWGNLAPIANAGTDISAKVDSTVILDGSKSFDPNDSTNPYNDTITYKWILIKSPSNITINNSDSSIITFSGNLPGEYLFELIVNDGILESKPGIVKINLKK